jgi:hypothetical protein
LVALPSCIYSGAATGRTRSWSAFDCLALGDMVQLASLGELKTRVQRGMEGQRVSLFEDSLRLPGVHVLDSAMF